MHDWKIFQSRHIYFPSKYTLQRREFFEIKPSQAIAVLRLMAIEDVTPTVQDEANKVDVEGTVSAEYFKRKRRPTFNFFMMGLKEGDVLKFIRNDKI